MTIVPLQTLRRRRAARAQQRNPNGEFHSGRSLEELFRIVRAGALAAVAAFPNLDNDPLRVRQRHWNVVGSQLEPQFGRIPQANEICRQVRERTGDPRLSWPLILALALGEGRRTKNVLKAISGKEPTVPSVTVAGFALLAIARRLGTLRPSPLQYDEACRQVLQERRRTRTGSASLRQVLPASRQTIAIFGSWDAALAFVGLGNDPGENRSGLPVEKAFALFYAATGRLPQGRPELAEFAKNRNFSLARMTGHTWSEWTERGMACIREFPELLPPGQE